MQESVFKCVDHNGFTYVITPSPNSSNISNYKNFLKKHGVKTVVRLCGITYDKSYLNEDGIDLIDIDMVDGHAPTSFAEDAWMFAVKNAKKNGHVAIAVHCISGIGRAPTLVCCALINDGYEPYDAIQHVRHHVKNAMNMKQVEYILTLNDKHNKKLGCVIC